MPLKKLQSDEEGAAQLQLSPKYFVSIPTHTLNFQHGKVLSISTSGEDKTDYKSTLKLFKCFLDYLQMVWHFHPPVRHAKCPRQFA